MSYIYCNICNIWFLDAKLPDRWIGRDGPTLWPPRSPDITLLNSFYGGMLRAKIFDTSSRYYEFEGKNNRRFCYSNWRHVGEHVERNWLSIRRSPCNKRSTCWSVLICCKKTSWVSYISKKKSLYSTYNSFLVINERLYAHPVDTQHRNLYKLWFFYVIIFYLCESTILLIRNRKYDIATYIALILEPRSQ